MNTAPYVWNIDGPVTRRAWVTSAERVENGWHVTVHADWRPEKGRVVLTQACFGISFEFDRQQPGEAQALDNAMQQALRFSARNQLRRMALSGYHAWVGRELIGFTGALKPAGWITGEPASVLYSLIMSLDFHAVENLLDRLGEGFAPRDYTEDMKNVLDTHKSLPVSVHWARSVMTRSLIGASDTHTIAATPSQPGLHQPPPP